MALTDATYYSNSIQGIPGAGVDVDITATHTAPKYPMGYLIERADGNRFRYCNIGTATNAGQLVGQTTTTAGATYGALTVVAPASAVVVQSEYPITPGSVGSHFLEVTVAGIAANKYEGSYLITTRGTGLGDTYRIMGNTATNTPATGNLRIQLYEAIKVALTVNTGIIIAPALYSDLAATATSSASTTGVLMSTTTSTNLWAWVCTRGIVGCTEDATNAIVQGQQIIASRVTAGSYASSTIGATTVLITAFAASPLIGYSITPAGSSSRQGTICIQCE